MTYQHLLTLIWNLVYWKRFWQTMVHIKEPIGPCSHLIFKRLFELHQGSEGQLMALTAFSTLYHLDLLAMSKACVELT